jgi:hypothetical protein
METILSYTEFQSSLKSVILKIIFDPSLPGSFGQQKTPPERGYRALGFNPAGRSQLNAISIARALKIAAAKCRS